MSQRQLSIALLSILRKSASGVLTSLSDVKTIPMKRPLSLTIISWIFIAAGAIGFAYHLSEINAEHRFSDDAFLVLLVRLVAVAGGILTLRGVNFGRWLLVAWTAYHVILSFYHDLSGFVIHAILLAVIGWLLFHSKADAFFKRKGRTFS